MKRLVRRRADHKLGGLHPIIDRLYVGRGVTDPGDVRHRLQDLLPPDEMKGLVEAASLVCDAILNRKRILIVGDFDADGATSCALLVDGLRAMGAAQVDYLVPNRFEYGYGLTPEIVVVANGFKPDLLVTVDNGISSVEGVAAARREGYQVLITDHHLPGTVLPDANAILNPNQSGCAFQSKHLAGVGVAFYLLSAVRHRLRDVNWFSTEGITAPNLADSLDLVALGTIADVVQMDANNRILVQEGIRRIRGGRARAGILALIAVSGVAHERLIARDLAFSVAPKLNAAGRLEDMSLGIACLLSTDPTEAMALSERLDALNRERRSIEDEMRTQAQAELDKGGWVTDNAAVGVCLFHEDWHQGVVGIVASRIKEQLHRPVIAFARSSEGELKGSARSIQGLHIRDALDSIAARHPGLVLKFGGHAMAAGLSLKPDRLQEFAQAFDAEARRWLTTDDLEQVLISDGAIDEPLTLELTRAIVEAAPWGQGFAEPMFDGRFEILDQRIVGGRHLKMKLKPESSGEMIDAIAFNHHGLVENRYQHMAYRVDINFYRGMETVQLIVEDTGVSAIGTASRREGSTSR